MLLNKDEICPTADLSNIGRPNGPAYSTGELLNTSQVLAATATVLIGRAVCRLWIVPKGYGDSAEPQQIGYVNVVPARNEFGVFDGFGDTVRKFNQHLRVHPLPGKWRRQFSHVIVTTSP